MGFSAFLFGLVVSASAAPTDSPILIRLVHPNVGGSAGAEAVMLQMTVDGQENVNGGTLDLYGPTGDKTGSYQMPGDLPLGEAQRTILLAAPEAMTPTPDFELDTGDALDVEGGAVCFSSDYPSDCVSWGSFPQVLWGTLPNPQHGNADRIRGSNGLGRNILDGCPSWLDPADDYNDTGASFVDGVPPPGVPMEPLPPPPRNNAAAPTETPCLPDTIYNQTPANPTNDTTPNFAFGESPPEYGATFECRVSVGDSMSPGQPWGACLPAGNTFGPLVDGFYSFQARAIGYGGTDPSPAPWTFEVDTVPPDTAITQVPPEPSSGFSASFSFKSTEAHSTFACQLESGPVQPCEPGKTMFNLSDGPHTFRVWASDQATNKDPTPAVHVFSVDTTLGDVSPPETTLLFRPEDPSSRSSASFTYRSNEPRSSFQCRLDDSPYETCHPTGVTYSRLKNGPHTFKVKATDRAGNTDLIPASYSWRISAPLPRTRITAAPPGAQRIKGKRTKVRFAFRSSAGSSFRCRIDKQPFKRCRSPRRFKVKPGRHRFEVHAIDAVGNEEARPVRRIFRVVRKGRGGGLF